jgi:hypothetical protein
MRPRKEAREEEGRRQARLRRILDQIQAHEGGWRQLQAAEELPLHVARSAWK